MNNQQLVIEKHCYHGSEESGSNAKDIAIAVALGDGIGPEITNATLRILTAAKARIIPKFIDIGEQVYLKGHSAGITPQAWQTLRQTKVFLKGPITTPAGSGYKSLNVTIRKTLGLYANVRPCISYSPFVHTLHPAMDLVIIRENEEDLYAGIEHRQTDEVYQCLKLITRPGCEKIIRYAFEYARSHGRKKVTCMVKDNIMKMTDGLFYKVFQQIGAEYPDISQDRYIIDIGSARLATRPELFDVIVTTNLYGDIISDIAAELSGSIGLAGSANIGEHVAMFEAIHGSAPDIAGRNMANPSGLLQASVMMLIHIGQADIAQKIQNAWLKTIEDGIHTADLKSEQTKVLVNTDQFAAAVIARLGAAPQRFAAVTYQHSEIQQKPVTPAYIAKTPAEKIIVGVDIFLHQHQLSASMLAERLQQLETPELELQMITNRGVKVWPDGFPETFCTDHWRCRFMLKPDLSQLNYSDIIRLLSYISANNLDVIKTENLCTFHGELGFTLGQGQ
jgi:isocitrate dehydrogenase